MKKRLMAIICVAMTGMLVFSGCKGKDSGATTATGAGAGTDTAAVNTNEAKGNEGFFKATDLTKLPDVAKNRKDTLVIGIDAPDGVFNPDYAESAYDIYITETLFDGLISLNGDGTPDKGIADSWQVSPDGLTYTFKIRDGAKFSDGSPITADDVAFTYTILCDKSYDGPLDLVNDTKIKGGKAYQDGTASTVEGIKVVDSKTIAFTIDKVNAGAIYSFGGGIIPKAVYGKGYKQGSLDYIKELHAKPTVTSGAYKFVTYKTGQEVDLAANENYWRGTPKIKNIIYKVTTEDTRMQQLQSGETDMDMATVNKDNVDAFKASGFLSLDIFPTNGYGYIGLNFKNPILADKNVRKALAIGLDRKQVVDAVYQGYADVINVPQSTVSWAYTNVPNKYEFDLEKAKKILDDDGWKVGSDGIREKDGKKLKLRFAATTPNAVNNALLPVAKENYKALGIDFAPEQMDFNTLMAKQKSGDFDMFFMAWGLTPDPDASTIYKTAGSQNRTAYSNPKVDELLQKGVQTLDTTQRKAIYKDLYTELNDDLPYIYMYQRRDMWVINGRISGFDITPYKDFTYTLYKAEIK